jgi:glycosyltransferase involved in cell wall biosynthesis
MAKTKEGLVALDLGPKYFIRPNNSEWRNSKLLETHLGELSPRWRLALSGDPMFLARRNIGYLYRAARYRMIRDRVVLDYNFTKLGSGRPRADIIYAYAGFPLDKDLPPILYHDGPSDIRIMTGLGYTPKQIDQEISTKKDLIQRADQVSVTTPYARKLFVDDYGADPSRTHVLPYFTPYLYGLTSEDVVSKHTTAEHVEILFVGRQARRKGVDILLEAFCSDLMRSAAARLTIVSSFTDGAVNIPADPRITVLPEASIDHVQQLMRKAHIFAMPSRVETFGIVYVEAMAAGAVCVAPKTEPQISLMDDGRCGCLVSGDADDMAVTLRRLCDDENHRRDIALRGLKRFDDLYSTPAIVRAFETAFDATLNSRS